MVANIVETNHSHSHARHWDICSQPGKAGLRAQKTYIGAARHCFAKRAGLTTPRAMPLFFGQPLVSRADGLMSSLTSRRNMSLPIMIDVHVDFLGWAILEEVIISRAKMCQKCAV